jgi:hypothetical protein
MDGNHQDRRYRKICCEMENLSQRTGMHGAIHGIGRPAILRQILRAEPDVP